MSGVPASYSVCCRHCGKEFPGDVHENEFCCSGCRFVYGLIHDEKLEKFYQLKPAVILPSRPDLHETAMTGGNRFAWLENTPGASSGRLTVSIEGIQCAACVWLIQRLAERAGIKRASVDSVSGTLDLQFVVGDVDLAGYLSNLQRFGYRVGPRRDQASGNRDLPLLMRVGVLAAIAMNSMTLSLAFYFGLDAQQAFLFRFFNELNLLLTVVGVLFGGSYFFRRAWQGLKAGVVHFDTTVSVGILVGFIASTYNLINGAAEQTYFDSLNGFIFLMLVGRFVQARTLEKQQSRVLGHMPLANQRIHRQIPCLDPVAKKQIHAIAFSEVASGDELIVASGGILPVDSQLLAPRQVEVDLQWISGESIPKIIKSGEVLPAGAKLLSLTAATVVAQQRFAASTLSRLEQAVALHDPLPKIWASVTRWYVPTILICGGVGFLIWAPTDIGKAVQVLVAVTVVTCPCALGIAVPLARTMANRLLTEHGVFARTTYLFERLQALKKIVFDKTGTLTLADLRLVNRQTLQSLSQPQRAILFGAVARSRHPASRTLYAALAEMQATAVDVEVLEEPGVGLHIVHAGQEYFFGRDRDASMLTQDPPGNYQAVFTAADMTIGRFEFVEEPVAGLAETMQWLRTHRIETFVCSGDQAARVEKFAAALNLPATHFVGAASPESKATFVQRLDRHDTMFIGDGINDALALRAATFRGVVSGTQPQAWMTSHVLDQSGDFMVYATDIRWLRQLIGVARSFQKTLRANLIFVFAYNICTIGAALAGWISPLVAAILMPSSSIFIVGLSLLNHG